jgi:CubicO group peptidase (beta-lactamase class C family)
MSYEAFLRENIFAPLGMKDSGYDRFEVILPRRATGYSLEKGAPVNSAYLDMGQPYSAGSLYSTTEDLFTWDRALAARKLLSAKSYEKMYTPFKGNYAYGWAVAPRFNRKTIGHGGGINGFSTMINRYPDDDLCFIVLSNLDSANAGRMSRDLEAILLGERYELARERVVAQVDPRIYDAYVGKYELSATFALTVTREGDRLLTQATNQPQFEVFPESETKFFLRVVDAQITFVKDAQGKVTSLILHQGGRDQTAKKVE